MRTVNDKALNLIVSRHINDAGVKIITTDEGDKHQAYRDIRGIWTIGYGHTGPEVHQGLLWTEAQALAGLRLDLNRFESAVNNVTHDVPTTDNQFSAMVSLEFNIGEGAFHTSHVLANHRAKNYEGAGNSFLLFDKSHVNGQLVVVPGLLRRRNEERSLYSMPDPLPQPLSAGEASDPPATAAGKDRA